MRRRSQEKLRGLCLVLPAFAALACGEDAAAPAPRVPGSPLNDWTQHVCENWQRRGGGCNQTDLIADYQECLRTEGFSEMERLRKHGVRSRATQMAEVRMTNLCLERRHWVMTEQGRASQVDQPKPAAPSS